MSDDAARDVLARLAQTKTVNAEDIEAIGWDPDDFVEQALRTGVIEVAGVVADRNGVMRTVYRRVPRRWSGWRGRLRRLVTPPSRWPM
jgi:hypothetical protein